MRKRSSLHEEPLGGGCHKRNQKRKKGEMTSSESPPEDLDLLSPGKSETQELKTERPSSASASASASVEESAKNSAAAAVVATKAPSRDGWYCPEGFRKMNADDYASYNKQVEEQEGYGPIKMGADLFVPASILVELDKEDIKELGLRGACKRAIKKYNKREKTQWGFERVIHANSNPYYRSYVTFEVSGPDNTKGTFQTRVSRAAGDTRPYHIEEVRPQPEPKPKPTTA